MEQRKRKSLAALSAVVLSAAIIVTGTFAWSSSNQDAKNETQGTTGNPGGRLHDDFNGEDKKVYVENYGNRDLYARVRLSEYMEYGNGAGAAGTNRPGSLQFVGSPDAKFNDSSTWDIHKPNGTSVKDCGTGFHTYFDWTLGGTTVYMPTFNKDNTSLAADIRGTLAGGGTGTPYGDYKTFEVGNTESAVEQLNNGTTSTGPVTHTAKATETNGNVITMEQWITQGKNPGNFWVYDTDGWAYWANPIKPDTATGTLLSSIGPDETALGQLQNDWYYAIDVVGQFATVGDWGDEAAGTGFYADGMTANGRTLLDTISGNLDVDGVNALKAASVSTTTDATVTIDGVDFYVLTKETDRALVWAKNPEQQALFNNPGAANPNRYEGSNAQAALQKWVAEHPTLNALAVPLSFTTRNGASAGTTENDFTTSVDQKAFLLSEADVYGTFNGGVANGKDYTAPTATRVVPDGSQLLASTRASFLRSPQKDANSVAGMLESGASSSGTSVTAGNVWLRPALYINIA